MSDVMRHEYRELNDVERGQMRRIKDLGLHFYTYLEHLEELQGSRELSLAKTKIEEAVMWATKHITR